MESARRLPKRYSVVSERSQYSAAQKNWWRCDAGHIFNSPSLPVTCDLEGCDEEVTRAPASAVQHNEFPNRG